MKVIDKSLSGHCHLKKTCAKDVKVLTKGNGISLGKCPNQLRRDLFRAYLDDNVKKNTHKHRKRGYKVYIQSDVFF